MDYYDRLYYHAYSFLREPDSSCDVVNDTFEVLWKNFPLYRDSPKLGPYLYRVVRNKCIDLLRRKAAQQRYLEKIEFPDSFREDYDYTDYDTRLEMIKIRIEGLPPRSREVFVSCYIDGCSYQEAAERLGISVNTVKTLLSRVLSFLREICPPA